MKLARYALNGNSKIGALVDGLMIDVASAVSAMGWSDLTIPQSMCRFLDLLNTERVRIDQAVNSASDAGLGLPLSEVTLLAPVGDPQKVICIGQNYKDHCEEQNQPLPERAIIFAKFPTSINDPDAPIVLPHFSEKVDYEAELAIVIGKKAKLISPDESPLHIAGYVCLNDISARDIQQHPAEKQWIRGKSPDGFAPIGPWIVTSDEIGDPQNLDIKLTLNGEVRQQSNTRNLIFGINYLVSHISQGVTLLPGDIIATGTPGGVGMYSNPQVFLQPGDTVTVSISGIGDLTNTVTA